jgi:hypothetical protein
VTALDAKALDLPVLDETLDHLLKYEADLDIVRRGHARRLLAEASAMIGR